MKTLMYKLIVILKSALLLGIIGVFLSFDLPTGWHTAGSSPESYEMGIDKGAGQDGKNAATIKSVYKKVDGFGTLMQHCKPGNYLGKRIKMTGLIKSANVKGWAGFWLRVDKAGSDQPLSFDNMEERAIKGTTGWTKYEIVLDVPDNALRILYGALVSGTGQIWFDNISFEIVNDSVPTTGSINVKKYSQQEEPTNLDFEK
jgi:hypothetical protein